MLALEAVRELLSPLVGGAARDLFVLPKSAPAGRSLAPQDDVLRTRSQGAHASLAAVDAGSRGTQNSRVSLPLTGAALVAVAAARIQRSRRKVAAATESASPSPSLEYAEAAKNPLQAFWKFLRPHTIRGTIMGSSAMVAKVVLENGKTPDWSLLPTALCGVVALLCGNGYIVGINQIYDVSIDVINKPFLPVAAKELSVPVAWVLITLMAVLGTGLAYSLFGPLIGCLYAFGLFLGTIYSVPPLRLKQSPVAAALIIATVRGVLLNVGVYYATRAMLGVPFSPSFPTAFMTCFCTVYAIIIAVAKDLPDTQGDLENNIETFATRFGVDKVSLGAAAALACNYLLAFAWCLAPATRSAFRPWVLLPAHSILLAVLFRGVLRLRKAKFTMDSLKAFYRLIWALFYSEYILFPFI